MRIAWLPRATRDLESIVVYLLDHDRGAARRLNETIRSRVALLAEQPALGRAGRIPNTRERIIGGTPYIVAYTVDHRRDVVIVLCVLHGARQWPSILP